MISMPGGWEWIILLVVALLIFGKRLPDVARSIGKALTEFRKGMDDIRQDVQTAVYESERKDEEPKKLAEPKQDASEPETEPPYESDDTHRLDGEYDEFDEFEDDAVEGEGEEEEGTDEEGESAQAEPDEAPQPEATSAESSPSEPSGQTPSDRNEKPAKAEEGKDS